MLALYISTLCYIFAEFTTTCVLTHSGPGTDGQKTKICPLRMTALNQLGTFNEILRAFILPNYRSPATLFLAGLFPTRSARKRYALGYSAH